MDATFISAAEGCPMLVLKIQNREKLGKFESKSGNLGIEQLSPTADD
jgi:hypothetical protein